MFMNNDHGYASYKYYFHLCVVQLHNNSETVTNYKNLIQNLVHEYVRDDMKLTCDFKAEVRYHKNEESSYYNDVLRDELVIEVILKLSSNDNNRLKLIDPIMSRNMKKLEGNVLKKFIHVI